MNKIWVWGTALLIFPCLVFSQDFFNEWDKNRNGQIEINEFPGQSSNMDYFNKMDRNRDGKITRKEFNKFMGLKSTEVDQEFADRGPWKDQKRESKWLKREKEKLAKEKKKAWKEADKLKVKLRKIEMENSALAKENKKLKKGGHSHSNDNYQMRQMKQKIASLEQENNRYKSLLNKLGQNSSQTNNELQRKVSELQNKIYALQAQLQSSNNNHVLQSQIQQKDRQIAQLSSEIQILRQNQHSMGNYKQLQQKVNNLQREKNNLANEKNKLMKQNKTLLQQLQQFGNYSALQQQINQLNKDKQNLYSENQRLKQQLKNAGNNYSLQQQVQRLNQQVAQLNKEKQNCYNENQRLKRQLQSAGNNQSMQKEIQRLNQQVAQLIQENNRLRNQNTGGHGHNPHVPPTVPVEKPELISHKPKPSTNPARNMLMAEEAGRVGAMRELAESIRGSWIAAVSRNVDAVGTLQVIGKLDPTELVGVEAQESQFDFISGKVTVPVRISRPNIIESIRRTNQKLSPEDYQELRYMFPEYIVTKGHGAWTPAAQKELLALYGAQLDARRKLVEQLRGVLIKSSTRMEDYVVKEDKVVASIETSLLIGVRVVGERIISGEIAESTIQITRPMFIYSMRKGLETHGLKMSPDEYQNLRNMLDKSTYQFVGKAAIDQ